MDAGFRVTTNTTLFDGADPNSVRAHFDELMVAGVESMMVSPGYTYDKAPDQQHFLGRAKSRKMFRAILANRKKTLAFQRLAHVHGIPDGQEGPDLHALGHADVLDLRMAEALLPAAGRLRGQLPGTDGDGRQWQNYGTESGNPRCANCMVHSGYEASGVNYTFGSIKGLFQTVKAMLSSYDDEGAQRILNDWKPAQHAPLVTIAEIKPVRTSELQSVSGGLMMATTEQEAAKIDQLQHVNPDELEHAAGRERENLEGWIPALASEAEVREALEKAFDYRGDITVTRKDGSKVEGYLFDRRQGATLAQSFIRLIPVNNQGKLNVAYADIAALTFSGRDTAAGKTFEAWVKKYWEKKAAGEKNIQIEPERLE